MARIKQQEVFFSLSSCFAAGVFLGAGLLHMLADSVAGFEEIFTEMSYPWPALLAAGGFALILFLDRVMFAKAHSEESTGALSSYTLLIILSLHSILAGAVLGMDDGVLGSLVILIAIIAHKGSAAFALAVSMHRAGRQGSAILKYIICFSLMTPLGVVLGLVSDHMLESHSGAMVEAVFDGIAAGTFIYIGTMDIMVDEFLDTKWIWAKFPLLVAGLGLMAVIAVWT